MGVSSPRFVATSATSHDLATSVGGWVDSALTVRLVRGLKMLRTPALMDEVSAAMQFPYYFGANWAALDECLADLEWLRPGAGYVVVAADADAVLRYEPEALAAFVACLRAAGDAFAEAIELGERCDRPPVPFHIVLQFPSPARRGIERWIDAGAEIIVADDSVAES
jgi:hypothetical protein